MSYKLTITQKEKKVIKAFSAWLFTFLFFAVIDHEIVLNTGKVQSGLNKSNFKNTIGKVIAKFPRDHNGCRYSFFVAEHEYQNADDCGGLTVGQTLTVYYKFDDPEVSATSIVDRQARIKYIIVFILVTMGLFPFLAAILAYNDNRIWISKRISF